MRPMTNPLRCFCFASLAMVAVFFASTYGAIAQSRAKKRAAPPKFNPEEVEDIFFQDARKALVGKRPARNTAVGTRPNPNGETTSPAVSQPPAKGGIAWSKLISPETLADEVKSYSTLLPQVTKTPGQFKGNGARNARRYFSTLAAVFAIIADYDGDVRWKNQAAAARQLFARAGFNSKSDNDNVFNEAKLRAEDLTSLIRGETIAAPPNIEPSPSFNEQVANRPPLMWRLERAQQDRLAVWTSNAGEFNKNLDGIRHEAEMVAALAELIQHKSYTDADSDSYIEYAKALQQSALSIREAAKQKNADAARTAAGNLKKACDNCHGDFRGN
jgi:cytochrome c'